MSCGPIDTVQHPVPILAEPVPVTEPALELEVELVPVATAPAAFDVELVLLPSAPDLGQIDVILVTDPLPALEQLRRSRRRWRGVALAGSVVFAVVGVMSCIQFAGTLVTCHLLGDTRQQAARLRDDNQRVMQENQRICAELHASVLELRMAQRTLRDQAAKWDNYERRVGSVLVRAENHQEKRDEMVSEAREIVMRDLAHESNRAMVTIRDEADLLHASLEDAIFLNYYLLSQGVDPLSLSAVPPNQAPPMNPFLPSPQNDGAEK